MKSKRGGIQFGWIFAVIVGAVILFLAFYFVGQLMMEERIERETVRARSLDIVITPLTYFGSIAETTSYPIELREASKIELGCDPKGYFGFNSILLLSEREEKRGIGGISKESYDKYLFGQDLNETFEKRFQTLTKPLYMPWRVADLTMIWPADREYCFVGSWGNRGLKRIKDELGDTPTGQNISSINFTESRCTDGINVCFDRNMQCDINVKGASREGADTVHKQGATLNYAGDALMYAAIFSDPKLYECNLKRIGSRLNQEIEVYKKKAGNFPERGCSFSLDSLQDATGALDTVLDPYSPLDGLWSAALVLKQANDYARCKLF